MTFFRKFASFVFVAFAIVSNAQAQDTVTAEPAMVSPAAFAVVMEYDTGSVLFSKSSDEPMAPASMAKLMTVAIIFKKIKDGELKLEDTFTVSERAWRLSVAGKNESSKMFVSIGSQIKVEDLLRGIIIQSGNDACTVVAEHFSGSEEAFSELMNAEAKRIGLKNSVFKNASGLPHPDMHVTAHDLAVLGAYLIREYPQHYHYFSEKEFTWNGIKQANRNLLLTSYPGADGLKTGHTQESGYGMVASALVDGRRLIVVVNGLKNEAERAAETKRLLDIGFREYRPYKLFSKGDIVDRAEVWSGEQDVVNLVAAKNTSVTMRRSQRDNMKAMLQYEAPLVAPVKKGQVVGKIVVFAPGVSAVEIPVAADADVEEGGLMTKIKIGVTGLFSSTPEPTEKTKDVAIPAQESPGAVSDE